MTVALPYVCVCVCVDSRREELEKRYTHTQEKKHTNYGQTTYPFRKKKGQNEFRSFGVGWSVG